MRSVQVIIDKPNARYVILNIDGSAVYVVFPAWTLPSHLIHCIRIGSKRVFSFNTIYLFIVDLDTHWSFFFEQCRTRSYGFLRILLIRASVMKRYDPSREIAHVSFLFPFWSFLRSIRSRVISLHRETTHGSFLRGESFYFIASALIENLRFQYSLQCVVLITYLC